MSTVISQRGGKNKQLMNRVIQASVVAALAGLSLATPSKADTSYFYEGPASGNWDDSSWASPLSTSLPLGNFVSSSTSDAIFNSTAKNITLLSNFTANSVTFQGTTPNILGTSTLTLSNLFNTLPSQSITFAAPIASPGQLTIHGVTYPTSNGKGVTLGADTNMLPGGILLTGGSVYLNLGNSAPRLSLPGATSGAIVLTTISGPNGTSPAITIDGNGSTVVLASIHTNDYIVPNPVVLNPSNASNFYTALGGGSVADSGTVANGPFPAYASINFSGQISGNGNVIISNDFYGGGGKGFTIFSNTGNNYTGNTIVNNNGQNYLTFQIGAQGAIPVASNLVFGAKSVGASIGDTSITGKQVGAMDLNGFDVTVKSLSSDIASNLSVLGITNVDNNALDANLVSGPHATDASQTSTLTIDSQGSLNNTFFTGNITDGGDFLAQDNATGGNYHGTYVGAASYLPTSAGLKVALKLAPTNSGVLTLNQFNGGSTPVDLGYTGGTTVSGGSLYVNGVMTAPSGTSSQVVVTTPIANHVALLGGTGKINPDIHIQSGAILAPGSAPAPLASGSGTSFNSAPTAFNTGTLTVNNLTVEGGSQINFVINDGSNAALAGTGYGTLAFSAGGSFTESGSVTPSNPVFVQPQGTFGGFVNYTASSWTLANFLAGTSLSNLDLDTRNGYTPVATALLDGGTFSINETGSSLILVFTPSPTVKALRYSGGTSGTWDITPGNTPWTDLVHGTGVQPYSDPSNVVFGTPTANTTITIQNSGTNTGVSPASVLFNGTSSTAAYTITGGAIKGGAAVSVNGSNHAIFTAANTYTGGTFISGGGKLETQISGALGTGDVTINNGTWATTGADQAYSVNIQVTGGGTTSVVQTGPTSGAGAGNLTLSGNISGGGSFTKTGTGNMAIVGNLSQTGDLNVTAGNLVIAGALSFGGTTSVSAGAGIEYQTAPNATVGFQSSANLAGNLTFDNFTNVTFGPGTYQSNATVNGSILLQTSGSLIQGVGGTPGGAPVDIYNPIVLNSLNGTSSFIAYVGMAGNGNRLWLHGPITGNGSVDFSAGPGQGGGADIDLYTNSTYTGSTIIETGSKAVITLQTDNALPATTQVIFGNNGSGAGFLDLNGHMLTVGNISTDPLHGGFGGIEDTAGGGVLTVSGNVSQEFDALIAGFMGLTVALQNNNVLDLSWNGNNNNVNFGNTYAGQTTITSGTLRFSNTASFSAFTNLLLDGGTSATTSAILEIHANNFGSFTSSLGTGFQQIAITGGFSGFSAWGGTPAVINLNGGGTVTWGSTYFNPSVLVLNSVTAQNTVTLQNNLDLGGADRTILVNSTQSGATAFISGAVMGIGGLTKTGSEMLVLSGPTTYSGYTTIAAGELQFSGGIGHTLNGVSGAGTLGIDANTSVTLANAPATANVIGGLDIAGSPGAWIGKLDLTNNAMVLLNASSAAKATELATVMDQINSGRNGGTWNGAGGITSSSIPGNANSTMAIVDNAELGATTFRGQTGLDANSIIIGQAALGDVNMDGSVGFADLLKIAQDFGQSGGWAFGHITGDGVVGAVGFADLLLVAQHFGQTLGLLPGGSGDAVGGASSAPVPEPASLTLLALGGAALLTRRRRR